MRPPLTVAILALISLCACGERAATRCPTLPRRYQRACVWGLIVLLMGCTRWESFDVQGPAQALPSYLRVSAPGQDSTVLVHPFVRRDTLYGRSRGDTLGIPLIVIEHVERPRLDGLRTAATVVGGIAAWVTVGLLGGGLE